MEDSLRNGCCHGASLFNRPGSLFKLEWKSDLTLKAYANFNQEKADKLLETLKAHNYPINRVYIFMEPNAFGLPARRKNPDFRQNLYTSNGNKMNPKTSSDTTKRYDKEYAKVFAAHGFKILQMGPSDLQPDFFYDAAHLTPSGSDAVGKFYAKELTN